VKEKKKKKRKREGEERKKTGRGDYAVDHPASVSKKKEKREGPFFYVRESQESFFVLASDVKKKEKKKGKREGCHPTPR